MAQFLDNTGLTTLTTLIKTDLSALKPSACLVTLKASGWDANAKTQTVTVSGVSADEASCMIIPMPAVANQSAYNDAGVNAVGQSANGVTFGCNSIPSVDLKVWVTWESVVDKTPPLAYKGQILSMDLDGQGAKQYRVLSMNGDVAKVVAMYDDLTSVWRNDYSTTTTMGTLTVAKYEGSDIDTYLNTTWYNTLTSTAKAAIVPENVVCDAWYWGNTGDPDYTGTYGNSVPGTNNYTISKYAGGTLNIGNRNVFALSVQDVIDYLNDSSVQVDTSAILRNANIWKMFWNDEVSHSGKYPWLRSSSADGSGYAWNVIGDVGRLSDYGVYNSRVVRSALNLNLNQIKFSIVS